MKILDKDLLPVVGATALASVMILFTGNGVAESVKQTEQQAAQKQLPPPGPFDVMVGEGESAITAPNAGSVSVPSAPKAPVMSSSQLINEHKNEKPTLLVKKVAPPSFEAHVAPKVEKAPVFVRVMPSLPQALQAIESPKEQVTKLSTAPKMPVHEVKAVSMPTNLQTMKVNPSPNFGMVAPHYQANIMPGMMPLVPPQQPPARTFNGRMPRFTGIAPKIQKYRYIPMPAYQAAQGYPKAPVYRGYPSAPRFQVSPSNKVNSSH